MSEDWKNDRAEAEMRKHEAEMMKKLNSNREKTITKTWTITATAVGDNAEALMSDFENGLVGLDSHVNKIDGVAVTVMPEASEDDEIQ
jgi:enoyl-[acyl-carrier-protein] reductase (NADH)